MLDSSLTVDKTAGASLAQGLAESYGIIYRGGAQRAVAGPRPRPPAPRRYLAERLLSVVVLVFTSREARSGCGGRGGGGGGGGA